MEQFVIHVPNKKIQQVRQFLADLKIRVKPVSDDQLDAKQTSEDTSFEDIDSLTAVGFNAWAEDWKDDAPENKIWEEFYKKQQRVSAR